MKFKSPAFTYFFFSLIFMPVLVRAQLNGTYCHQVTFESICITFNLDRTFSFREVSCGSSNFGLGFYELKDNQVILKFRTDTLHSFMEVKEYPADNQDSIFIEITAVEFEGNLPIPTSCLLRDKNGVRTFTGTTDSNGKIRIVRPFKNDVDTLYFIHFYFRTLSQAISLNKNYRFNVFLFKRWASYLYNKNDTLTLNYVDKKKLVLEWLSLSETHLYEFKKIKKRRKSN